MLEKKPNFYMSPADRKHWNDVCAYIRNHKNYNSIKNMRIAPDRASTTRIWYEKELQKEGAKRANI